MLSKKMDKLPLCQDNDTDVQTKQTEAIKGREPEAANKASNQILHTYEPRDWNTFERNSRFRLIGEEAELGRFSKTMNGKSICDMRFVVMCRFFKIEAGKLDLYKKT
jgi:hypothetical protein